jgi:hypothetical protein
MHPAHALEDALADLPGDINALKDELASIMPFSFRSTRDNQEAKAVVDKVEALIRAMPGGGATRVEGSVRGWHIRWHADWWMLYGTLYVNKDNDVDITSPIMIVDRRPGEGGHDAVYGSDVPGIAKHCLAAVLLWHELRGETLPTE